ncbi:protein TRIGALACTOSYLDIACYLGLYCEROL 4, chloroplastic-like [Silene latifolia]|uniref:protein TRIGALACTOSYLDIACYLGLYCEROL 4, chloroplastic-like n=1 Tax=Silene latifolia TaxID=37657 RepID=UPI003D77A286
MANLNTAMDAAFYDLELSSPVNLDGCAKAIPGDPFPIDGARAGRALRVQQLSFLKNGFPLGIIPCFNSPSNKKELGSFALQSLLLRPSIGDWWLGLIGQFRPQKLLSNIKAEISACEEWDLSAVKDVAKHVLDKSLYTLGLCTQIPITEAASLFVSSEAHGERKGRRNKLMLFHKLPYHDLTVDAAWPELFVDYKGKYWNIPESISLDLSSLTSDLGFRYRFGVHKNGGKPQAVVNTVDSEVPAALLPGLCARGAFSYEKSQDLWRVKETDDDLYIETTQGKFWRPAYDVRLKEPHASISAIIGGTFGSWLWREDNPSRGNGNSGSNSYKKGNPLFADMFGSLCYTFQHGKFRKIYGDLTRIDARLDVSSLAGLAKNICQDNPKSLPRLGLIFQQQVAGPIVFRIDTKYVLGSPWGHGVQMEDFMCSLSYSLRLLQSGKVVAWYSPKKKEGMIELRLFEF